MKDKIWSIPYLQQPEFPKELLEAGCKPLLAAVLSLRGIQSAAEARRVFGCGSESLHDPFLMKGIDQAVQRIQRAISEGETVAVYGDYDVDGITATCLLTHYLRSKGLRCLPHIPDRDAEGYGVNRSAVDMLLEQGVALMITVDCGITAREETAYAMSKGMDVIISDHHECGSGPLPAAVAVIDPKQEGETYPNIWLAGVGVALKLACACEGDSEAILAQYCGLVAMGTIADVMPLVGENRALVKMGLKKLADSPRPGMIAILREAGIERDRLTAGDIGFIVAPRLNAAGRLGRAEIALEMLLCDDTQRATQLARELCELNRQRQCIETEIWRQAVSLLDGRTPDGPIVLAAQDWHQGVIGIAASKLAEQYSLPAIMISLNGDTGKGSCRSYGGFNFFEALSACSGHLLGFGGHALAAGLTIRCDQLDAFREALARHYRQHRPEPAPDIRCDMLVCDPELLSLENVRSLRLLEPFGSENPKPILCLSGAMLESMSAVGGGRHLRMHLSYRGAGLDAIYFNHTAGELGLREGDRLDLAFTPQINEYRGTVSVQLLVCAARPHRPRELCRALLSLDRRALWAAAPYMPERADFVRSWRLISAEGFCLGRDEKEILAQTPDGMEPETFCLCLAVLHEAGLLAAPGEGLYGAAAVSIDGKADLEGTEILRFLRSC